MEPNSKKESGGKKKVSIWDNDRKEEAVTQKLKERKWKELWKEKL
jgi:hypothetical protein